MAVIKKARIIKEMNVKSTANHTGIEIYNSEVCPKNQVVLVISPHHDDSVLSCGATIKVLGQCNELHTLVMTAGYHANIAKLNNEQKISLRESEVLSECRVLGSNAHFMQSRFYDHGKKFWSQDMKLFRSLQRDINPDIILLPQKHDRHITHRLSTQLVMDCLKKEKVKNIQLWFYEGPWFQLSIDDINLLFCYDKDIATIKNQAIKKHKSQLNRINLIKAQRALSEYRAATIPELKFVKHGETPPYLGEYIEAYQLINY